MQLRNFHKPLSAGIALAALLVSGCASVPSGERDARDPFESYNRAMFQFNEKLDDALMKPVAEAYEKLPRPITSGISNFFGNLGDVTVFANDLLQLKLEQAVSDLGRVTFNTTAGLGGLIDVATGMDFPKHNEDFGQTLGRWGVPIGPYFVLPVLGPSSVRDAAGVYVDYAYTDPVTYVRPDAASWELAALRGIDTRANLLRVTRVVEEAAFDKYIFIRESYFQRRAALVNDGNAPQGSEEESFDKILEEDKNAEKSANTPNAAPKQP